MIQLRCQEPSHAGSIVSNSEGYCGFFHKPFRAEQRNTLEEH